MRSAPGDQRKEGCDQQGDDGQDHQDLDRSTVLGRPPALHRHHTRCGSSGLVSHGVPRGPHSQRAALRRYPLVSFQPGEHRQHPGQLRIASTQRPFDLVEYPLFVRPKAHRQSLCCGMRIMTMVRRGQLRSHPPEHSPAGQFPRPLARQRHLADRPTQPAWRIADRLIAPCGSSSAPAVAPGSAASREAWPAPSPPTPACPC